MTIAQEYTRHAPAAPGVESFSEGARSRSVGPTGGPLQTGEATRAADRFKALADPTRLRLLSIIVASSRDEVCVRTLTEALGVSQPTVSHHVRKLVDAGLLVREKEGRTARFTPVPQALEDLRVLLTIS